MSGPIYDEGFLQFMRDQGAQRAYRDVAAWIEELPILGVLGKINSTLLVIDARREAFRNQTAQRHKDEIFEGKEGKCLAQDLKAAIEARKRLNKRAVVGRKKPKHRRPTR